MKKYYLLSPGPTPVPPEVLLTQAQPMIHHRTKQFSAILDNALEGMKKIFKTKNPVLLFTSSGTGAMEAAVVNTLSAGDKAIVIRAGKFGERWGEICAAYGVDFIPVDVEWGTAVDPKVIERLLSENPDVKAVFSTLSETSTCVAHPIKELGEIVSKTDAILVVDAISGLGAQNIETDAWKIDVVVSGSQKGLMLPPGLAFATVSKKAEAAIEKSTLPKYYFSFKAALKNLAKNTTPYTPAVSLVIGLEKAVEMINSEGIDVMLAKYERLAKAVRAAAKALGLKLLAEKDAVNGATAILMPEDIDATKVKNILLDKHGFEVAGGQAQLKGRIIRIAHMGYMDEYEMISVIAALEMTLKELGYKFTMGSGVQAVLNELSK